MSKGIPLSSELAIVEVSAMEVVQFVPEGGDKPTQVHIVFQMMDSNAPPFVMRLKSGRVCDSIIRALSEHRREVFGEVL